MKTIIIVHHTGEWGGGTKSLVDLCEMLRDGYNVVVCIPCGFPDFSEKIIQYGCKVHEFSASLPIINIYSGRPPLVSRITLRSIKSLRNIKRIGTEILSLNPDIVIFNTLVASITSRYISRYTKVICIDRETLTNRFEAFLYRKLLDKHLDAITFLADYERRKLNFRKAKTVVFPDCVRMETLIEVDRDDIRSKENIPFDKFTILYMGGISKIKGTDVILEALEKLDERFLLILAGAVNEADLSKKQLIHDIKYPGVYLYKKKVKKFYYKLKGTPKILEVGLKDSVDELIVASDIVVFPSTSVHQPRPCIEAGAYGKPVIISDYKETREYFRGGYNALTFCPRDAADLSDKIKFACEHQNEMLELGNNNRIMTESKHDYYKCKKIICSLIERVYGDAN